MERRDHGRVNAVRRGERLILPAPPATGQRVLHCRTNVAVGVLGGVSVRNAEVHKSSMALPRSNRERVASSIDFGNSELLSRILMPLKMDLDKAKGVLCGLPFDALEDPPVEDDLLLRQQFLRIKEEIQYALIGVANGIEEMECRWRELTKKQRESSGNGMPHVRNQATQDNDQIVDAVCEMRKLGVAVHKNCETAAALFNAFKKSLDNTVIREETAVKQIEATNNSVRIEFDKLRAEAMKLQRCRVRLAEWENQFVAELEDMASGRDDLQWFYKRCTLDKIKDQKGVQLSSRQNARRLQMLQSIVEVDSKEQENKVMELFRRFDMDKNLCSFKRYLVLFEKSIEEMIVKYNRIRSRSISINRACRDIKRVISSLGANGHARASVAENEILEEAERGSFECKAYYISLKTNLEKWNAQIANVKRSANQMRNEWELDHGRQTLRIKRSVDKAMPMMN